MFKIPLASVSARTRPRGCPPGHRRVPSEPIESRDIARIADQLESTNQMKRQEKMLNGRVLNLIDTSFFGGPNFFQNESFSLFIQNHDPIFLVRLWPSLSLQLIPRRIRSRLPDQDPRDRLRLV